MKFAEMTQPVQVRIVRPEEARAEIGFVYREVSGDVLLNGERVLHMTPYENKVFRFLLSAAPGRATIANIHSSLYGGEARSLNAAAVFLTRIRKLLAPLGFGIGKSGHKGYRFLTGPAICWVKAPFNGHMRCELCGQELKEE